MADEKVGEVYISVGGRVAQGEPGRTFNDLKKKIASQKNPQVQLDTKAPSAANINATLNDLKARLESRLVDIRTRVVGPRAAQVNAVKSLLQAQLNSPGVEIAMKVNAAQLIKEANAAIKSAVLNTLKIRVQIENLDAEAERIKSKLNDAVKVTVNADLDTGALTARMLALLRPRTVDIKARLDASSMAGVSAALSALSGFRVAKSLVSSFGESLMSLDKGVPKIAGIGMAVGSLVSVLGASVGGIFQFASGLLSVAPAALLLPGALMSAGIGVGVLTAALKDTKTVLGDLGPMFGALQDSISASFWERAAQPIRDMVNTLLPAVSGGLSRLAGEFGGWAVAISGAMSSATGIADIQGIINRTADAVNIAGDGVGFMTSALLTLGNVGAGYMAPLASAFNSMAERFNDWVQAAYDSGDIFRWIDAALSNLAALGSILGSIGSILGSVMIAANAASGGGGLGGLALVLQNIAAIVGGPAFMGAMTTVFSGMYQAASNLVPVVSAIAGAFVALAPTISNVLNMATLAVQSLGLALTTVLADPAFGAGLQAAFAGILVGVQALSPAISTLGPMFGAVFAVVGQLASILGPVLGAAITALAPAITGLAVGIQPLITALGGALVSAITAVAPLFQVLGAAFMQILPVLAPVVTMLGQTLTMALQTLLPPIMQLVQGILPLLIQGFAMVAPAILQVVQAFMPLVGAVLGALVPALLQLVQAALPPLLQLFQQLVPVIISLVPVFAQFAMTLAGLLVSAIQMITPLLPMIVQAFMQLLPVIAQILPVILNLAATLVGQLAPVFLQLISALLPPLIMVFQQLVPVLVALMPVITMLAQVVSTVLVTAFQILLPVITTVFSAIVPIIQAALQVVMGIIQVFAGLLSGNWGMLWNGLVGIVTGVFNLLVGIVTGAFQILISVIVALLSAIGAIFSAGWNLLVTIVATVISLISSAVSTGFQMILSVVTSVTSAVWQAVSSAFQNILSTVVSVASAIFSAVSSAFQNILSTVISVASAIFSAVSSAFQNILSTVISVASAIFSAVSSAFQNILSTVISVAAGILSAVSSAFSAVVSAVVSAMAQFVSSVSSGIGNVLNFFGSLPGKIISAFGDAGSMLSGVGRNIIEGLIGGVKSMAGAVTDAIAGVVGGVKEKAKALLGIHSPSRVFRQYGVYTGEGYVGGVERQAASVKQAVNDMLYIPRSASIPPIPSPTTGIIPAPVPASAVGGAASAGATLVAPVPSTLEGESSNLSVADIRAAFVGLSFTLDKRGGEVIAEIVEKANRKNARGF